MTATIRLIAAIYIDYDARAIRVETRAAGFDGSFTSRPLHFPYMNARYLTADVFTDTRFGGNQLAVFPDARKIAPELMPQIAREFNYSETTFVLPPADPKPYCQGAHLHAGRRVAVRRTSHGRHGARAREHRRHHAHRRRDAHRPRGRRRPRSGDDSCRRTASRSSCQLSAAKLPEVGPPPPSAATLAAMLSLSTGGCARRRDVAPESVSCGTPFLFVPLRDRAAVARARIKLDLWEAALARLSDEQGLRVRDGRRATRLRRSRPDVRAGHRRPGRSGDRKRRGGPRRLSGVARSALRRHAALDRRAGLRDGTSEHSRSRSRQGGRPRDRVEGRRTNGDGVRRRSLQL